MRRAIEVVAGVITSAGAILCVQRDINEKSYISEKWEFPGGKIELGESPQDALRREIAEELEIDISVGKLLITVQHDYPDLSVNLHAFLCSAPVRHLNLTEHIDYKWLPQAELSQLDWAAADLPIIKALSTHE